MGAGNCMKDQAPSATSRAQRGLLEPWCLTARDHYKTCFTPRGVTGLTTVMAPRSAIVVVRPTHPAGHTARIGTARGLGSELWRGRSAAPGPRPQECYRTVTPLVHGLPSQPA